MRLGGGGQLPRLPDAADVTDVGLDDVHGLALEELAELDAVVDALTGRDRDVHLGGNLQGLQVLRRDRLLQPRGLEGRELAGEPDGGGGGETAVHLQHQLGLGADRVAHGLDQRDGVERRLVVELEVPVPKGSIYNALYPRATTSWAAL